MMLTDRTCIGNVGNMEPDIDTRDLWTEVLTKLSWSLRREDVPFGRLEMKREPLQKLAALIENHAGSDDMYMIERIVTGSHSNEYVEAWVNSLYAFKHLAPAVGTRWPLAEVSGAIRGTLPPKRRYEPIDFSETATFEAARPTVELVMAIISTNSSLMQSEFLKPSVDGTKELIEELKILIARHPDKASVIPGLIRERDFDRTNINEIGSLLDNSVAAPLLKGTL